MNNFEPNLNNSRNGPKANEWLDREGTDLFSMRAHLRGTQMVRFEKLLQFLQPFSGTLRWGIA